MLINALGLLSVAMAVCAETAGHRRRDGFASMHGDATGGELLTRPLCFRGKHLFVNLAAAEGSLEVELLDQDGNLLETSLPIQGDATLLRVKWKQWADLAGASGKPVRFRFRVTNGDLYSFWVSPSASGASQGYIAGGGPGLTGPTDTVGKEAYER